jgi:hypothetical protein
MLLASSNFSNITSQTSNSSFTSTPVKHGASSNKAPVTYRIDSISSSTQPTYAGQAHFQQQLQQPSNINFPYQKSNEEVTFFHVNSFVYLLLNSIVNFRN